MHNRSIAAVAKVAFLRTEFGVLMPPACRFGLVLRLSGKKPANEVPYRPIISRTRGHKQEIYMFSSLPRYNEHHRLFLLHLKFRSDVYIAV